MGSSILEPATIIARGAGATTIVRSDEVAARVMQNAVRSKQTGAAEPVSRREGPPDGQHSARGLDALRQRVGHVSDVIAYLASEVEALEPETAFVVLISLDRDATAVASDILAHLHRERAEGAPTDMETAPLDIAVVGITHAAEIDVARGAHVCLMQWTDAVGETLSAREDDALHLLLSESCAVSFRNVDNAASIRLRTFSRDVILRAPPSEAAKGFMDVIL